MLPKEEQTQKINNVYEINYSQIFMRIEIDVITIL